MDQHTNDTEDAKDVAELVSVALSRAVRRGTKPDIDLCRTIIERYWDAPRFATYGHRRYIANAKVSPAAWELIKSGQSRNALKGEHVYPAKSLIMDWFEILKNTGTLPAARVLADLKAAPFAIITKDEDDFLGAKEGKVKDCMPEGWTSEHEHGMWARYSHRGMPYDTYKTMDEWLESENS